MPAPSPAGLRRLPTFAIAAALGAALLATLDATDRYLSADIWDLHDMCAAARDPIACLIMGEDQRAEIDAFWQRNMNPFTPATPAPMETRRGFDI